MFGQIALYEEVWLTKQRVGFRTRRSLRRTVDWRIIFDAREFNESGLVDAETYASLRDAAQFFHGGTILQVADIQSRVARLRAVERFMAEEVMQKFHLFPTLAAFCGAIDMQSKDVDLD